MNLRADAEAKPTMYAVALLASAYVEFRDSLSGFTSFVHVIGGISKPVKPTVARIERELNAGAGVRA